MICPKCKEEGRKSTITSCGCTSTLMGWSPYYDEEGNYHSHDPNGLREQAYCSNKHKLDIRRLRPCRVETCTYGKGEPEIHVWEPKAVE